MHIKKNYVLREIAGEWIVIAKGTDALRFNSTILLNETGAFLFRLLAESEQSNESLLEAIMDEYEVDVKQAKIDVDSFVENLEKNDLLE